MAKEKEDVFANLQVVKRNGKMVESVQLHGEKSLNRWLENKKTWRNA